MKRLLIVTTIAGTMAAASMVQAADPPTILRGGRPAENPTVLRGGYGSSLPSTVPGQGHGMACPLGYVLTDEGTCARTAGQGGNSR